METTARTIIFFGRPGSGKGTQAKLLADKEGWAIFSTGARFKALRDEDSAIGASVRSAYDAGKLLPDWFAEYLFAETMLGLKPDASIICEGFPRSLKQAQYADEQLSWLGRNYTVINLAVSDAEVTKRLMARSAYEHRPDSDDESKIQARLATYEAQTAPTLEFFKHHGKLIDIDGEQTPEAIAQAVRGALSLP